MSGGYGFSVSGGGELLGYALIVVVALVLGALRLLGHKSQAFQAVAHLFVGGLFGAFWVTHRDGVPNHFLLWVAVALSVLELLAFLVGRRLSGRAVPG